jgi:ankyrin repeat protein
LKRNVPLVRVLVASSADVNAADNEEYTPLDYAVDYTSSTEIRSILRKRGAKLKQPHRDEIIDAAAKGDLDRLKKLLAQGIDLQVNSIYRDTPLHAAAENGWKEVVKFLIRNGAEVDSKNRLLGGTPLYYASNTQVATLLIESGADVNRKHTYCHTSSIVSETVLHKAARDGNKQMVKLLISKDARLDSVNPIWGTPLHVAARTGKLEVASILIANGADVNAVGGFLKQTPLDLTKTDEMKQLLRSHGALTAEELKQKQ